MNSATILTPIAPNVWILASMLTLVLTGLTLISPDEAPRFIKTDTHAHSLITISMQHYISTLPSTTSLLNSSASYQYTSEHSKPQCDEYLISPEFRIWQHLEDHCNGTQLHHLVNIPSVPIDHLYKYMINNNGSIIPFVSTDESLDYTASLWALFSHTGIYIIAIGLLIPAGLGIFCCYFFWCWPARLVHWPLWSGSL